MGRLNIIAAIGKNNELGKNNNLIWKVNEDMQFFKEKTMGHPIVMGRETFESLPKLLPGREHIVLTSSSKSLPNEVIKCNSIKSFFDLVDTINDDIFIIGGATIYNQFIDYVSRMFLTEFNNYCSDADVFFPLINYCDWDQELLGIYDNNDPKYIRKVYTRKK